MNDRNDRRSWWGKHQHEAGTTNRWRIGPLEFWVHRGVSEWRLAYVWTDDDSVDWSLAESVEWPAEGVETERFAVSESWDEILLRPLPADRPVVARPKTTFRVLPGHSARVFVSSPLWIEIGVGDRGAVFRELPARRLSDTWFGATTREGELCYALKTSARTSLDDMPRAAYRLLTPVVIENRAENPLLVERLNLPIPFLSIFGVKDGSLWSEEVRMVRTDKGDEAELDIREGAPAVAAAAERLSEPRQIVEKGHLFRAFGSLLGLDF